MADAKRTRGLQHPIRTPAGGEVVPPPTEQLNLTDEVMGTNVPIAGSASGPLAPTRRSARRAANHKPRTTAIRRERLGDVHQDHGQPPERPRAPVRWGLWVGFGVATCVALTCAGLLFFMLFVTDRALNEGKEALVATQEKVRDANKAIEAGNWRVARKEHEDAQRFFTRIPDLPALAISKQKVRDDLDLLPNRIDQLNRDLRVRSRFDDLMDKMRRMDQGEVDMVQLRRDMVAYQTNPIGLGGDPDPEMRARYQDMIAQISLALPLVEKSIVDRVASQTTAPAKLLQGEIEKAVQEERFSDGEAMLRSHEKEFPKSDIRSIKAYLDEAAKTRWSEVEIFVKTRFDDVEQPGLSLEYRRRALADARARLDKVISTWGVEPYVEQAKTLRARFAGDVLPSR